MVRARAPGDSIGDRMSGSNADPGFDFDNSYQRLPDRFYARIAPTPVSAPRLMKLNTGLADLLGQRE